MLEMTMRAKRYQNSAALLIFMRRTTIPHSSFLIRAELSNVIMGRHARGTNPELFFYLQQRLNDRLEVMIQFFRRRLHFVFAYPPLDHFDEAAGDVIQEEIFGDRDFLVAVQEVGSDEAGEARLEVAQEEVGAFGDEQVAQVVRILCDVL